MTQIGLLALPLTSEQPGPRGITSVSAFIKNRNAVRIIRWYTQVLSLVQIQAGSGHAKIVSCYYIFIIITIIIICPLCLGAMPIL